MIVYDIFVIITAILQITAAVVAIMLMKYTKFNISWVLFSVGLVFISIRRVIDFVGLFILILVSSRQNSTRGAEFSCRSASP